MDLVKNRANETDMATGDHQPENERARNVSSVGVFGL